MLSKCTFATTSDKMCTFALSHTGGSLSALSSSGMVGMLSFQAQVHLIRWFTPKYPVIFPATPDLVRSATGTQHCEAGTPLLCLPSIVCGLPNPFLPIVLESHGTIIRLHFELRQFMDRIQNDGWITDIFAVARELLKLWELDQT